MLLEAEKQRLQEDLEKSRGEQQKNMRELQVLQARLKDASPGMNTATLLENSDGTAVMSCFIKYFSV